ncbi:RBBP9/YdeN family alpha/beta hydrolase [Pseudomonas gingeri]|uniref:Serine hydrolase family protein n=1 Tax=Pseudomonas gingeri TaxID=117681 RepID=A0A7Y8CLN3_9PSED|nr:alpha/beta hydrolase [Pseudomonas gingeri]NWB31357.1 serine hydrolase family protein [Pseudomonas gingeri]NWC35778.1 serine hydrolase family protein [Pseudomonas gingeri]
MTPAALLLPGIGNSGPDHWQTLWAHTDAAMERIGGQDWHHPVCAHWVENLEAAVRRAGPDRVLVAHSLGCLQVAHWAHSSRTVIRAALLVAVPDPDRCTFPNEALGFSPLELKRFAFPSTVVASANDPHADMDDSQRCADAWGSRLVNIGDQGHINAASGLGAWLEGRALLEDLVARSAEPGRHVF